MPHGTGANNANNESRKWESLFSARSVLPRSLLGRVTSRLTLRSGQIGSDRIVMIIAFKFLESSSNDADDPAKKASFLLLVAASAGDSYDNARMVNDRPWTSWTGAFSARSAHGHAGGHGHAGVDFDDATKIGPFVLGRAVPGVGIRTGGWQGTVNSFFLRMAPTHGSSRHGRGRLTAANNKHVHQKKLTLLVTPFSQRVRRKKDQGPLLLSATSKNSLSPNPQFEHVPPRWAGGRSWTAAFCRLTFQWCELFIRLFGLDYIFARPAQACP